MYIELIGIGPKLRRFAGFVAFEFLYGDFGQNVFIFMFCVDFPNKKCCVRTTVRINMETFYDCFLERANVLRNSGLIRIIKTSINTYLKVIFDAEQLLTS